MPFEPAETFFMADDLRQCILIELENTIGGVGDGFDSCVVPGNTTTWDNCCPGSLRVRYGPQTPTDRFPDPLLRPTNCQAMERAAQFIATVLRCHASPNADGTPPPCDVLAKEARILAEDMDALWRAVACCLGRPDAPFSYVINSVVPVGPEGACVGSELTVTVGLTNWCQCG